MENLIERIENDFNAFLDKLEYVLGNIWSGSKRYDFVRIWELYLQQIDYSNNEKLLCIFNTTDKEVINKTFNDNIRLFDEIVEAKYQEVGEQYDKSN